MCLSCSATNEENHSNVAGKELNNRSEPSVGEWLGVENFSEIRGVVLAVWGSCRIPPLSRSLP